MCGPVAGRWAGLSVLKFGSSLLAEPAGFRVAAAEIEAERAVGRQVVVVVSAMRGATDGLLDAARSLSARPPASLLTLLLRTGEHASAALLGMTLVEQGVNVRVLSAEELGLRTRGPVHDAEPVRLDRARLEAALAVCDVVVVPGFVGIDERGHPSVLGRGGSDLTALFLGEALGADRIRLVKDVDGVYAADPRVEPGGRCMAAASWDEVRRVGNGVVQDKALRFAASRRLRFHVGGPGLAGTAVGPELRGGAGVGRSGCAGAVS